MEYDVIVVGGGIGGLTAAALLAARGVNVCLFERQSCVGGCVQSFEHLGYSFEPTAGLYSGWGENGVWKHVFSELRSPSPNVSKLSPSYVVRLPSGRQVAVSESREKFESEIAAAFPDCAQRAILFFRHLEEVTQSGATSDEPTSSLLDGTSSEFRLFVDAQLQTLTQRTSGKCSITHAAIALTVSRSALWKIEGGAQSVADALAESIRRSGGVVRLDSPVLRLAYASDGQPVGIDLLSGARVFARRAIVSNLTVWDTYGKLFGPGRTPREVAAMLKQVQAWGAYLIFAGLDDAGASRLPAEHLLLVTGAAEGPHYQPDEQQLFLNVASAGDSRGPDGKRALTISTFTRAEDWFAYHEDETSHEQQDQAMLEQCWTHLHRALPELGDTVEVIETASPRSVYDTTRRKFGMIGAPEYPAGTRSFEQTVFANVHLVGDTTNLGFGLEGAARSAVRVANSIVPNPDSPGFPV